MKFKPYWNFRDELDYVDGVVYKSERLVIPPSMRKYTLDRIHSSHMGREKCKSRARDCCFWPGINQQIEQLIEHCEECQINQKKQQKQPMTLRAVPDRPWEICATDLFEFRGEHFVIIVDYFSKWISAEKLECESAASVISALMTVFATNGFPDRLTSDNGPQYSSYEFKNFCKVNNIKHTTSSPHYPQSNGEAERGVGTVKHLWKKAKCKEERLRAVMEYNNTSLNTISESPAQILMGRRLKTSLIVNSELLKPKSYSCEMIKHKLEKSQLRMKEDYDKSARKEYNELKSGEVILYQTPSTMAKKEWQPATVVQNHESPQSYVIDTGKKKLRRNRVDLKKCPENVVEIKVPDVDLSPKKKVQTENLGSSKEDVKDKDMGQSDAKRESNVETPHIRTTRSGRVVKTPARVKDK